MIKKFNSYLIKENIDLNEIESLKIFYNTPDEAVDISEILMNLGYKVYDFEFGNLKKESNDWDCFVYEDDMFCLAKKSYIKSKFKEISYIDFINKYWNKKFKKIENPDLDPYGEEDWGWEEIKENIDLNEIESLKIFYNTLEEAVSISEILVNFGYKVYDFESVKKDANDWQCFIFYDHEFCLAKASFNLRSQKYKEISYIDFINKYGNKKIKKIENPEIDPYGEDDWGWEEIKENKLKKYNELFFGGSDMRDAVKSLNRDLKWGARDIRGESFFIKDLQKSIFGRKRLVDELKDKLIGKRVAFFYDRDRGIDGTERRKEIMTIKDVINNVYRTILFIGTPEMGHERSLVIREDYPITILPEQKRVFNEIDPYGEEDWEDEENRSEIDKLVNENKLNESIYPPITITNKLEEYIRKYGWSITMLDLIGNTYVPIDIDRDCDIGKITIDTYVIYAKDSEWYIPFDCVGNKKFKKIENPDLDPYGEEDWGYEEIKENKITFKLEHKKLRNYNILFDNEYEAQQILLILDELGFVVDIHNVNHRSKEGWTAIVHSGMGFCFGKKNYKDLDNLTYGEFLNMVGINTKYKKIERPDLDPYGEEDWGYEEITENKEVWIEKDHFETDDIVKDTRYPEFGKGVIVDASRPDYIIIEYENRTGYSEKNCEKGKGWSTGCDYVKYFRFLSNSKSNRKKRKKIERPDIDPYGEEDWGYEEIKENNEYNDLRGKIIYIQNQFEYDELMKYLENTGGYLWVAGQNPTGYEYQISIPRCLNVSNSGRLRLIDYQVETIKASDILEHKLKKFKKIYNPDLDPYGEEDWGWEEIKENKKNSFEIGDVVIHKLHPEFGDGPVIHIEGDRVYINFENETGMLVVYPKCQYNHGWQTSMSHIDKYHFIKKGNKKFKKIYNPDLDPYGEEDWGWEEIKEI